MTETSTAQKTVLPERRCPKARSHKPQVEHDPHVWIAGVYLPVGDVDGYRVQCPGWSA